MTYFKITITGVYFSLMLAFQKRDQSSLNRNPQLVQPDSILVQYTDHPV